MFKKVKFHENLPLSPGGAVLKRHYNVNPFLPKKIIKLPYSIAISCDFHVFSKYPYLSRFTFYQKVKNWLYNTIAITFFWLIPNLHFKISNLQKIATNDTCTCDLDVTSIENLWFWAKFEGLVLSKMAHFWLFLKKIHRVSPVENSWFLANFGENS